ncbi:MAG: hypothetical protein FWG16_06505, partial [Micrococcales bacterium]|nr:hypothetical protein [Micrococcales bacterium]
MRIKHALTPALALGIAAVLTFTVGPAAFSADPPDPQMAASYDDTYKPGWDLKYRELFTPADIGVLDMDDQAWVLDNMEDTFDTMSDDDGQTYWNEMGIGFGAIMRSFRTWEKIKEIGEDGWITVVLTGRQQDLTSGKNAPERGGVFHVIEQPETGNTVAELRADDPTSGAMIRNTKPMPPVYRMEYTVTRYEMGGDRYDPITGEQTPWSTHPGYEYGDNGEYSIDPGTIRYNGFTLTDALGREHCKSQHPWPDSSTNPVTQARCSTGNGLTGDDDRVITQRWNPLYMGSQGYNGLHALTVVDTQYPKPRNLHFWHYHRKVLMDQFATDRLRGNAGAVCNSETGIYTYMGDTDRNGVNPWVSGRMNNWSDSVGFYQVGRMAGQSQRFFSDCNNSVADPDHAGRMIYGDFNSIPTTGSTATTNVTPREPWNPSGAGAPFAMSKADPRLYPYIPYTFAVERIETGYTLEWSGFFQDVGWHTYRYYRPFITNNYPVWRYNNYPGDHYDGRWNGYAESTVRQWNEAGTSQSASQRWRTWPDIWHAQTAYPDFVLMGVEYTNSTEGWLQFDDVRFYEPANNRPAVSALGKAHADTFTGYPVLNVEVINLEEYASIDSITVVTDFGTKTLADVIRPPARTGVYDTVYPDEHPNFKWSVAGSIPDGVAEITVTKGAASWVIEVPYEGVTVPGFDDIDEDVAVTSKCLLGYATVLVSAKPDMDVDSLKMIVNNGFGTKEFVSALQGV